MKFINTIILICSITYCNSQDFNITHFDIPELGDATTTTQLFLEDIDGSLWLFTRSVIGEDVILKYSGDTWDKIDGPCNGCVQDVAINNAGLIYMAAGIDGLYQYNNDTWSQILEEDTRNVFVDATGQLAVITDQGAGRVIDNQFVATNNDGFMDFSFNDKVITRENRMYFLNQRFYEYCYGSGWTDLTTPPITLGGSFNYFAIGKDTSDLLHYSTNFVFVGNGDIGTFDSGIYAPILYIIDKGGLYDFGIDPNNIFWTIGPEYLTRLDGTSLKSEWLLSELFPDNSESNLFVLYKIFIDSNSNCWLFNRETGKMIVLHLGELELGAGNMDEYVIVVEDCSMQTYDIDRDGFTTAEDCDDYNFLINPGRPEIPNNGRDDDCDPNTHDNDIDGDGFLTVEDCDDNNAEVNPGMTEVPYNDLDDDCDPTTLDDDLDQDGFVFAEDCDDTDPMINPDAEDIPNNDIDENCDGTDLTSSIHTIAETTISIYPNPASEVIFIDIDGPLDFKIKLCDLEGRLITELSNSNQLNVESIGIGIYFLKIIDQESSQSITERVVIEN